MIVFGLVSSVFDYPTFGTLLILLSASVVRFRTGWFVESVLTEFLTLLVTSLSSPSSRSPSPTPHQVRSLA